jgi:hypothetical protein
MFASVTGKDDISVKAKKAGKADKKALRAEKKSMRAEKKIRKAEKKNRRAEKKIRKAEKKNRRAERNARREQKRIAKLERRERNTAKENETAVEMDPVKSALYSTTPPPTSAAFTDTHTSTSTSTSYTETNATPPISPNTEKPGHANDKTPNPDSNPTNAWTRAYRIACQSTEIPDPTNVDPRTALLVKTFSDRWYSVERLKALESSTGLRYVRGKFSDEERVLAYQLTFDFCRAQNMSLEDFRRGLFECTAHKGALRGFFVHVAPHFKGRPLSLICKFFRRMLHPGNHRGNWSKEDNERFLELIKLHGTRWELIAKEFGRTGSNCMDRYKIVHKTWTVGDWTADEIERYKRAVGKIVEEARKQGKEPVFSWKWISEQVNTRSQFQCYNFSKNPEGLERLYAARAKYQSLFEKWSEHDDRALCSQLYDMGLDHEREIDFTELAHRLRDETNPRLRFKDLGDFTEEDLVLRWKTLRKRVWSVGREPLGATLLKLLNPKPGNELTPETIESEDELF